MAARKKGKAVGRKVGSALIKRLIKEAGGKCANPGCMNYLTHIHHIKEWHIHKTHDEAHMIAICPSCHDAVHRGALIVDDETIYRWKNVKRPAETKRDHFYVEPGQSPKLLLGTIAVTGDTGVVVINLGSSNMLSFRVVDGDVFLANLAIKDLEGRELVRVVEGNLRHNITTPIAYERIPGHIRITAPVSDKYLPEWALEMIQVHDPSYGADGQLKLLELQVLEPGLVRIEGIWAERDRMMVVTRESLSFVWPKLQRPVVIRGEGVGSLLKFNGPLTRSLFAFQSDLNK